MFYIYREPLGMILINFIQGTYVFNPSTAGAAYIRDFSFLLAH